MSLDNIQLYFFDMDGTIYLGDNLFSFTPRLLSAIKASGKRYLFLTNNSSKSVEDYVKKLHKMGVDAQYDDFLTSSQAMAYYLKKHHPGKMLYVCGTNSLKTELEKAGFSITEDTDKAQCVVMGFDTELTFRKLWDVSYMLTVRKDLPYIATNPDLVCPTEFGSVPDCGSVCDMIYNSTGRRPVVIGKPEPLMLQLAMEKLGVAPPQCCMVGDRIYTDIKSGLNAGAYTVLVMSGETTPEILEKSPDKPHCVMPDASGLFAYL